MVAEIEVRLARNACVGDLRHWARYYRYGDARGRVSPRLVYVTLNEAGKNGFRAGRFTQPPFRQGMFDLDDREQKIAFASYDTDAKSLKLEYCGPNLE